MKKFQLSTPSNLWQVVSLSWMVILLLENVQSFSSNVIQRNGTMKRFPHNSLTPSFKGITRFSKSPEDESEFTNLSGEAYTGDIDWDGEWKKVVEQRGAKKDIKRPGKYKSDVEIAATKVTRAAQENVLKTVKVVKVVPSWNSLKNDPKFWIGILALISVGLAVLTAPQQGGYYPMSDGGGIGGTNGSYYI